MLLLVYCCDLSVYDVCSPSSSVHISSCFHLPIPPPPPPTVSSSEHEIEDAIKPHYARFHPLRLGRHLRLLGRHMFVVLEPTRLLYQLLGRIEHGVALVVTLGPEERVRQNDVVDVVERRVVHHVAVDEEEDWEVDFLASTDFLFFEAEALDLCKVGGDLGSAASRTS